MDQSKWEDFTQKITNRIKASTMDKELLVIDEKTLNKKWHNLNLTIKQAATKHIPFTYKQTRRFYAFKEKTKHDLVARMGERLSAQR
ncbi:46079_t:CDS:2 [Gigaspora margarita]|uniref:46079_t:CDS:1 n=1 Tax=Gigaspora margarita TaxID=4874 RepID=A0ABN7VDG2_GIGMA|nr:46079_t:CDS:2 [Gigaspora margarita]